MTTFLIVIIVLELLLIWLYSPGPVDTEVISKATLECYKDVSIAMFEYEPPLLGLLTRSND